MTEREIIDTVLAAANEKGPLYRGPETAGVSSVTLYAWRDGTHSPVLKTLLEAMDRLGLTLEVRKK